jgi:Putative prokaryotic signal transducing protein
VSGDGGELVEVAYTADRAQAEMIRGLLEVNGIVSIQQQVGPDGTLLGYGLLNPGGGSRRVMVRAVQAEEARAVLADAATENGEEGWSGIANADHLADAGTRKPRSYGLIGGYARAYLWSIGAMALFFGVFMLLRVI